jgi:predicted dehydrogenase
MSDTLERRAKKTLDAAQMPGKIYAIVQNYRYVSGPRRLKAFLDSKIIGDVTTVNADMYLGAHFGGFRDEMEHVLLLDMAIHTFDMARFCRAPIRFRCFVTNGIRAAVGSRATPALTRFLR